VSPAAVAEPVVHHELQPSRDEHVQMRNGHEGAAREQITAHLAGIGFIEIGRLFAKRVGNRHVAAEARAGHTHPRATQIVVAAVGLAPIARIAAAERLEQRGVPFRSEKIVLAHIDAMADQCRHREQERKPVPDAESIGQCSETSEQALAQWNSHVPPPCRLRATSAPRGGCAPLGSGPSAAFAFWNSILQPTILARNRGVGCSA
jgi:hypothetical protein